MTDARILRWTLGLLIVTIFCYSGVFVIQDDRIAQLEKQYVKRSELDGIIQKVYQQQGQNSIRIDPHERRR